MSRTQSSRPVIGVTCGEIHNRVQPWSPVTHGQSRTYVQSVIDAGGTPLLLPLSSDSSVLQHICTLLDGLLLAGGNDINPSMYGQMPASVTTDYSDLRDSTENALLAQILAAHKPILALCRGMQLLNIHYGGTLHQDLPATHPGLDHDASTKQKSLVDLSHTLQIKPGSRLGSVIGAEDIGANAHHHQAIDRTGDGIQAVAWAQDGIIEGIELIDYPYALGVQPHPESLTHVEPRWAQLFSSFVQAAGDQRP